MFLVIPGAYSILLQCRKMLIFVVLICYRVPVRTIFDAHPDGGVVAMSMTRDAKYLATLSAADTEVHTTMGNI